METLTPKAERTRQLIIEKSAHLFNLKGYAGTSIQDVMAATGLTKGGIYGHFESKEEIAVAAFEFASQHIIRLLSDKIAGHTSATAKLKALMAFYKTYLFTPPISGGCPILNTSVEADDTNPQLRAAVVKVLNKMHKAVSNIVKQGIEQQEFKGTAEAGQFAVLFVSMIEGGIMVSKAYGDAKHLNIVLQHLEQYIERELKL